VQIILGRTIQAGEEVVKEMDIRDEIMWEKEANMYVKEVEDKIQEKVLDERVKRQ
jgi:hypothetical protein